MKSTFSKKSMSTSPPVAWFLVAHKVVKNARSKTNFFPKFDCFQKAYSKVKYIFDHNQLFPTKRIIKIKHLTKWTFKEGVLFKCYLCSTSYRIQYELYGHVQFQSLEFKSLWLFNKHLKTKSCRKCIQLTALTTTTDHKIWQDF